MTELAADTQLKRPRYAPSSIDGRRKLAKRHKELIARYSAEVSAGRAMTERDRALILSAASLTLEAEALTARAIRGEADVADQLVRITNGLSRVVRVLNITAKPKAELSLPEYLRSIGAAA